MIRIRRSEDRGTAEHGWLRSRHTFSFADYWDPDHMGFRGLRVINEDRVAPGAGFPTHPHRDMEILSYVLEGALAHRDSMGTGSVIRPGELQRMSAGNGVLHSEMNASRDEEVRFLQIWLVPGERGIEPGYEQKAFPASERTNRLRLLASPTGDDGGITVHTDVRLFGGLLEAGASVTQPIAEGRHGWLQVTRGSVRLSGGDVLHAGDGAAVSELPELTIEGSTAGGGVAEVLFFDLA